MGKRLNIELSESNEQKLQIALCAEFRRNVHTLQLFEQSDRYGVQFQIDGLIGLLVVYIDKPHYDSTDSQWTAGKDYYKVSCDDCVWYLTYDEIVDVSGIARGIGQAVREYIRRHI